MVLLLQMRSSGPRKVTCNCLLGTEQGPGRSRLEPRLVQGQLSVSLDCTTRGSFAESGSGVQLWESHPRSLWADITLKKWPQDMGGDHNAFCPKNKAIFPWGEPLSWNECIKNCLGLSHLSLEDRKTDSSQQWGQDCADSPGASKRSYKPGVSETQTLQFLKLESPLCAHMQQLPRCPLHWGYDKATPAAVKCTVPLKTVTLPRVISMNELNTYACYKIHLSFMEFILEEKQ